MGFLRTFMAIGICLAGLRSAACQEPSSPAAPGRGTSKADSREASSSDLAGVWRGKLETGVITLRIVFDIQAEKDGRWSATLDSPDQSAFGIPVSEVRRTGDEVKIEVKDVAGEFTGKMGEGGRIVGRWKQGGTSLDLTLRRGEKVEPPKRPQEPKPPFPYAAEDVNYENKDAGITLAGTLTLPKGDLPVPAVILISGSGPQDRNEELLGHKPFLVLADYLTRHGIAVLRADDRGVGKSTGDFSKATTQDFVTDTLAGVAYLKTRSEIDPRRIGLIGHSEGGLVAPLAAVASTDVAFIVLLAGPGVTGEEIVFRQNDLISAAMGIPGFARAINRTIQAKLFAIVKANEDNEKAAAELRTILRLASLDLLSFFKPKNDEAANPVEVQIKTVTSPWFRQFLTYDPKPTLEKVRCPVLALNGELDLQVCPRQNLPVIEAALHAGGNPDYTIRELSKLNHLFQECRTGSPSEYSQIEETLNPTALEAIREWLESHARPQPTKP